MKVYCPDTKVYCDPEQEVKGTIIRVFIESGDLVRYRVQYWEGGSATQANFRESELTPLPEHEIMDMGFRSQHNNDQS